MNTAIVTGATGFIGIHLVYALLSHGTQVTALCRKDSPRLPRLPSGVRAVYGMDALPPADVFFHLAWENASGPGRGDAFAQMENARLCLTALDTAHTLGCQKFIALGTVYERLLPQITARGKFSGPDFYVLSKTYAHAMADKLAYKLGIDFCWCTVCHPIGRYMKPDQLMAFTVAGLLDGAPLAYGPATSYFDMVAVEDAALGLFLAGTAGIRREYFIGSGLPQILRVYLEQTRDILFRNGCLRKKAPLHMGARPDDGLNFEREWFDISPLTRDTGYVPQVSFEDAVTRVAEWASAQRVSAPAGS